MCYSFSTIHFAMFLNENKINIFFTPTLYSPTEADLPS